MSLRPNLPGHTPRAFTNWRGHDSDGGDEITLSDVQIEGLRSIARHDRATALRINTRFGNTDKATDLYITTYSHDLGWNALGYQMRASGHWCVVGHDHWKPPDLAAINEEAFPPSPERSAYHSTKDRS